MADLIQYLISITAAAIICAIARVTADEKTVSGAVIRLIAGLIMVFTVIAPAVDIDFGEIPVLSQQFVREAQAASAVGEEIAAREVNSIIKDKVEAYILDKAASLGAVVQADLQMVDSCPAGVVIRGTLLPGVKQQLQQMLESDLGIAKENQKWIQ